MERGIEPFVTYMVGKVKMDMEAYLKQELPKLIGENAKNTMDYSYHLLRLKRFLMQTGMIFILYYLTLSHVMVSYPALPIYPPLGISFILFYLVGSLAFWGIFLGSLLAYSLKGLSLFAVLGYSFADIGAGWLGAYLCGSVFSSDLKPFSNLKETLQFLKINVLVTCVLCSLIQGSVFILNLKEPLPISLMFFYYLDLWLADLSAIFIYALFLLSWVYVPFSREKISGYLMSTAVLFFLSNLYLVYFVYK